jgi:TolA-binding protein
MKKFYFLIVALSGLWWYASRHFDFNELFAYAHAHPAAQWAPKVEYSIAMVYYQRGDNQKAQEAFTQLLTDFPTGQYEGHALLRLSEVAEDNLDIPTAKETVKRYLEDFPDGPDRQLAEKRKELLLNR